MSQISFRSDSEKRPLAVGDTVKVCGIPDLSGIYEEGRSKTLEVFKYALGRNFKIESFDDWNCAQFHFYIPLGTVEGWHAIVVEPYLLKKLNLKNNCARKRLSHGLSKLRST